ncbi:MAG: BatA and WFA domain-containing protein [Planctomycetota bacterium]
MTLLAILTGLSFGWLVAGTLAMSLPIAAHLLTRSSGPRRVLPTVRFLQQAVAEHARRNRLRDILLLVLRCACILLLALMFDRPIWSAPSQQPTADATIIIVDASASMQRIHQGRTLYDTAVQRAMIRLADLDPSHLTGAIIAGSTPRPLLPRLSTNRNAITQALEASTPTLEHADLAAALTAAAALPLPSPQPDQQFRRRILVITDAQASQWADITIPTGNGMEIIRVGPEAATPNIAITGLRLQPSRPLVDTPLVMSVDLLSNDTADRSIEIVGAVGEATAGTTAIVPAAGTASVSMPFMPRSAGLLRCTATINDPAFPFDDVAHLVTHVTEARDVILMTDADADDPNTASFYLQRALHPGGIGPWRTRAQSPGSSIEGDLAVVVEVTGLDARGLDDLATRVTGGLRLLWIVDSPQSAAAATDLLERLDIQQTIRDTMTPQSTSSVGLRLADGRTTAPQALAAPDALGAARPTVRLTNDSTVLLRVESGEPALVLHQAGQGAIALLATSLNPSSSALHRAPLFPVLMHFMLHSLLPNDRTSSTGHIGEPLRATSIRRASLPRDANGRAVETLSDAVLRVQPLDAPGFIDILDRDDEIIAVAAADIDPRESDMQIISTDAQDTLLQSDQLERPTIAAASTEYELWPWILLAALTLLGLEQLISTEARRA